MYNLSASQCPICAQWVCDACGWKRVKAFQREVQECFACGSRLGVLTPTRHFYGSTYDEHVRTFEAHPDAATEVSEAKLRAKVMIKGLQAGAIHRGEAWPIGTLVRWKGAHSKHTYRVTDIVPFGPRWSVQITPLTPGPGRSRVSTEIRYLRKVEK
jgi:hypothetical protein